MKVYWIVQKVVIDPSIIQEIKEKALLRILKKKKKKNVTLKES